MAAGFAIPFAPARTPSVELAQAAPDDSIWEFIADSDNETALESFIATYPNSRHVPAAKARLAALKGGTTPPPVVRAPPVAVPKPPVATTPPPVVTAPPPVAPPPRTVITSAPIQPTQDYAQPHAGAANMNGLRLDWCLAWATDCGKPAADAFCQAQGYGGARSFEKQITGGPTWIPKDMQLCIGPGCGALSNVVCETPVKAPGLVLLEFVREPRLNQIPLAECAVPAHGCGQAAADAFCQAGGFARAQRFGRSPEGTRSIHLGDLTICDGPQCRALKDVSCSR